MDARDQMLHAIRDAATLSGFIADDDPEGFQDYLDNLGNAALRPLVVTLTTALSLAATGSAGVISRLHERDSDRNLHEFGIGSEGIVAMSLARIRDEIDSVAP